MYVLSVFYLLEEEPEILRSNGFNVTRWYTAELGSSLCLTSELLFLTPMLLKKLGIIKRVPSLYEPPLMCPGIIPFRSPESPVRSSLLLGCQFTGKGAGTGKPSASPKFMEHAGHREVWLQPRSGLSTPPWLLQVLTIHFQDIFFSF